MTTAIIAVLGTLAGALLTGTLAHLSQRAQRVAAEATARRAEALAAVTDLGAALADHRRTMWVREDLRLRGEDWAAARAASHTTRSAITAPLLRVSILLPALTPAAQTAADAACGLRAAADDAALRAARQHAVDTAAALVTVAATTIGTLTA
ncbi:protein kilB [Streptomyces fimicarius]|uniref:protein kilB n=1 Tax=Streptomyces TaxID=1883 RepID=UPI0036BC2936